MIESAKLIALFLVIFYAGINLGFGSRYQYQVNEAMLQSACYNLITEFNKFNQYQNFNSELKQSNSLQKDQNKLLLKTELSIPDSPFVPVDDSIFIPKDSLGVNQLSDSVSINGTLKGKDSLKVKVKVNQDSLRLVQMSLDSTARLQYFRYQREDVPFTTLQQKKKSKFFVEPSPNIRSRTISIDSTGKYVEIKELFAGKPNKIILRMPIDDYIKARLEVEERKKWEAQGYAYELKDQKLGLGDLIKNLTDFEIPLPSVGVLSIFGTPKISLKIGGSVTIHGAWRSETTEGVTASRLGNTRNEPDFKQQVQINVNGTIGDKLNIVADWNTERTFEYENQLKIKYTGYEDEIIQSIEAGNVSLQTSPLVGGSEALFGIKALFKMGPFSLTTIASQKKGETKEVSVSSGASETTFEKRAFEYSTNHYFIDTTYASKTNKIFENYYGNPTPQVRSDLLVTDIQVWKSVNQITPDNSKERFANAFIDLGIKPQNGYDTTYTSPTLSEISGKQYNARFLLLTPDVDYILHPETGFITFKTSINESDIIAVAYAQYGNSAASEDDIIYGDFLAPGDTNLNARLVLKMIKPANLQPGGNYTTAWSLMLKNIYPTGVRNIKPEGFEFDIKREIEGGEAVSEIGAVRFLKAFKLDLINSSGSSTSDNIFDYRPGITIIPETGEIIFPTLEPFGSNLPSELDTAEYSFNEVYNLTKTFAAQADIKDKWILVGKSKGTSSATYQLGFNVVENSVKVTLNGRELSPGSDYIVDYNVGQLTIRNDAALVAGADLKITYEQNDLFQLASKTLLGARGIYEFSKKTKLGFSVLNLNQQTLSDKVRIGEEPLSNTIYGVDFTTQLELPVVTKLLDNVFSTREMSSFNFAGEYAYIDPDPNTKKSKIVSDQNKSIAYIDDFEGSKKTIPIGVSYTGWKDLSPPDSVALHLGLSPSELMEFKGKSFWFTETPSRITVEDIYYDRKQVGRNDQQVTAMEYVFLPDTPGTYNYFPRLDDPSKTWGGMQKILSSTANNLVEENIEFIEFWAQVISAESDAKIYLDLGRISEDVIPNKTLNTEDRDQNEAIDIDGKEDTGIDTLTNAQEQILYGNQKSDPSGDDFYFKPTTNPPALMDYFSINGTEGNAILTDIGRLPDTEDLNRNGNVNTGNNYYRYEIPLDTNAQRNQFIAGGGFNPKLTLKWYLFRIPLKEYASTVGSPSLSDIEGIRIFVQGLDSMLHFRITEFNLVGNQWQKNLPNAAVNNDSVLSVSVVSLEENLDYSSPPGVFQERDRTRPDEEIYRNEQSLNLGLHGLAEGDKREVIKYLFKPLDVFNYKQMKLFVHGDENDLPGRISYADTLNGTYQYTAEVYFRFGGDTNNYYEYRQPVLPGWNEISINFEDLTSLKALRGDSITIPFKLPVEGAPIGHFYGIKGNPTLTSVKYLLVGIVNLNNNFNVGPIEGEVWINELRVVGADDSPGWAYSFSSSLKLADFATVSFNLSEKNPYFHKLAERFGSRIEQQNWAVSTDVNLLKLLPFNLPESNLRLNYSHTESIGKPLYIPGSDVKVDEAVEKQRILYENDSTGTVKSPEQLRQETESQTISDSWSASNIKIKIPTKHWLIRDTFNALTLGFNYNKTFSRSPTVLSNKSWIWNANLNYGLSLSPTNFFNPIDIPVLGVLFGLLKDYSNTKVYFTPQSFALTLTAKRNASTNTTRPRNNSPSTSVSSRDFTTSRGFNFSWKLTEGGFLNLTTTYSVSVNSSLAYLETYNDSASTPRSESEIWNEIFGGAFFGRDNRYQQNFDLRTAPKLPSLFDLNKFFTLTASYGSSYQWNNDFRQEVVGRSAGFSNKSSVGLTMRWKSLFDQFFKEDPKKETGNKNTPPKKVVEQKPVFQLDSLGNPVLDSLGNPIVVIDSAKILDSLLIEANKPSIATKAINFLIAGVRYVLFDYEMISFNFSNDNSLSKSGLQAKGTGFSNFWGIFYNADAGPTRGFMLGLNSDAGPRVAVKGVNLSDVYSQKNNFDFKTSRPLWEGAKIDLNWKSGWSVNKNSTLSYDDATGDIYVSNITSSGTLTRSFVSFPPVLFLSVFKSGIKQVAELYESKQSANLSEAFIQGFESVPIFANFGFLKNVSKYIPRPNWRLTWDGLEKLPLLKAVATRVSLDHSYSSSYTEGWKLSRDGKQEIQVQKIDYSFAPLAGLNLTFGQLWGGNLSGNLKYSTRTSYDLGITTSNITENFSKDIGFTIQFSKSGFELPLFGVALKNDIEFSLAYSNSRTASVRYDMNKFTEEGTPQDGTTRVTIEPRIKYTISAKVTLSIFYKRSTVEPEGASRIPPTTTNEAGLDVSISIN